MTDTQQHYDAPHYATEAQRVEAEERAMRPKYREDRKRVSLHINFAPDEEAEMLYYRAFRALPHGLSKRVVIKFLDILIGNCQEHEEARNILYHWTRARDEAARMAMTGGAPLQWRQPPQLRATHNQATTQQAIPYNDFIREQMRAPPPGYRVELVPTGEGSTQPPPAAPPQPAPAPAQPEPAPQPEHIMAQAPAQGSLLGGVMGLRQR